MQIHRFAKEDLRILASLAIDLETDHLEFEVFTTTVPEENYWSISCRFAVGKEELETWYDAFVLDSGSRNEPETYQMCWFIKKREKTWIKPITSPLIVVHYFEELCKKNHLLMN